jgi:hypothetical protein
MMSSGTLHAFVSENGALRSGRQSPADGGTAVPGTLMELAVPER